MAKGLPKPWNIHYPPTCTTTQSMQFCVKPPSSCPRHCNPDSSFQVSAPYHRIDGYGPPPEEIGHIDDIYVDLTTGSQMIYARTLTGWAKWPGLRSSDNGYIQHSSVNERYLWCSTKGISWFPGNIVREDPAESLGVGDGDAICYALRSEFEKQRKKKEKASKRAGSEEIDDRPQKKQKPSIDGAEEGAMTQKDGSGEDNESPEIQNQRLIQQNEQLEQNNRDQLRQIEELKADVRSMTDAVAATASTTLARDNSPILDWAAPAEDVKPQIPCPSGPMVLDEDLSKEDYERYSEMKMSTLINLARKGDFVTELNHRVILAEARTRSLIAERDEARLMADSANEQLADIRSNLQRMTGV